MMRRPSSFSPRSSFSAEDPAQSRFLVCVSGHVAHAEVIKSSQQTGLVLDGMAALDADECGDPAGAARGFNLVGGCGEDKGVRVASDDVVADGVDHLERTPRRAAGVDQIGADVGGEELRADAARAEFADAGMPRVLLRGDVPAPHGAAGDVVVAVDQQRRPVHGHHLFIGQRFLLAQQRQQAEAQRKQSSHGIHSTGQRPSGMRRASAERPAPHVDPGLAFGAILEPHAAQHALILRALVGVQIGEQLRAGQCGQFPVDERASPVISTSAGKAPRS